MLKIIHTDFEVQNIEMKHLSVDVAIQRVYGFSVRGSTSVQQSVTFIILGGLLAMNDLRQEINPYLWLHEQPPCANSMRHTETN